MTVRRPMHAAAAQPATAAASFGEGFDADPVTLGPVAMSSSYLARFADQAA